MNEAQKQVALIQASAHKFKSTSRTIEDNTNPRALSSIDEIFTRLKAIGSVGNAFKNADEERVVKQEWMLALREEGVTKQHMIDDGIDSFRVKARKTRGTAWFPSIGQFIDLCKGSDNTMQYAERALKLFNSGQKQIDSVGRMVTAEHSFELRQMKASESNKMFIEYYLSFAGNNEIKPLESHLLTETVQLSEEKQKDAENRANEARNSFLNKFSVLISSKQKKDEVKHQNTGIVQGKIKHKEYKSPSMLEAEKKRQLDLIKDKL